MRCPECHADTRLCQCAEAERDEREAERDAQEAYTKANRGSRKPVRED